MGYVKKYQRILRPRVIEDLKLKDDDKAINIITAYKFSFTEIELEQFKKGLKCYECFDCELQNLCSVFGKNMLLEIKKEYDIAVFRDSQGQDYIDKLWQKVPFKAEYRKKLDEEIAARKRYENVAIKR